MSLSSVSNSAGTTVFSQLATPAASGEASNVPGTRGGPAPAAAQPADPSSSFSNPGASAPGVNPLEAYAKKPQDGDVPAAQQQQGFQPKLEDLNGIVNTMSQHVKPDAELMSAAMRGDSEAMNQFLSDFGKQVMQHTLFASTTAANQMQKAGATQIAAQVTDQTQATQARSKSLEVAAQLDSRLGEGIANRHLQTAVDDLRAQYPTAPADLIGKEAARQLAEMMGPAPTPEAEEFNWLEHTQSL